MIDASIALGIKPMQIDSPMNALAQMMQIKQAQQSNQLNSMQMDEYQRGVREANGLRALLKGDYANPQARQDAMMKGGYLKEATDYGKTQADIGKTGVETEHKRIETAHKKIDLMGQAFGFVKDNPSAESATRATDYLVEQGIMTPEQAQATKARIAADPSPETIRTLATQAYQNALSSKDQLPKLQNLNAGNRQVNQSVNPITGRATETGSTAILQSPDSIASNATSQRGQNMTAGTAAAGRAQSASQHASTLANGKVPAGYRANADGSMSFIPGGPADPAAGGGKPPTEFQGKSASFGARAEESDKILSQLEKEGVSNTGIIKSVLSGVGEMVPFMGDKVGAAIGSGMNTLPGILGGPSGKQQQVEQARRDFVNAVLRQESGAAIAASEFDNAVRQYFSQPGDTKEVIAQKSRNRKLVIQGFKSNAGKAEFSAPPAEADIHSQADAILGRK